MSGSDHLEEWSSFGRWEKNRVRWVLQGKCGTAKLFNTWKGVFNALRKSQR